jgi:Rps23 Pro-64 3,4-dihydroxylase Tpa1-like proline 4-hydroxylase
MNFEIPALGLVYYKNAIDNPQELINKIESLELKRQEAEKDGYASQWVKPWIPWEYDHGGTEKTIFNWQKFLPKPEDINQSDIFYNEQYEISSTLFNGLESCLNHYFTLYPYAQKNIKSRERTMHLLKYEKAGFLPAHSDHGISSRVLSAVLYLNDDYEGGNIKFQHAGVDLKPEAGSIIFFPSNYVYVHEVDAMISGTRYSLPNWYHNRKNPYYSDGSE